MTDDAFATIFKGRTRAQKSSEVMSTLSRTVEELEQPMGSLSIQGAADSLHQHADDGAHKIELRHADGSEAAVTVQVNAMSGQFLPFRPPPLPTPQAATTSTTSSSSAEADAQAAHDKAAQPQTRMYKAVFTIEETTDAGGEVKILAHSPELIEEPRSGPKPRSFLERMALRQVQHEDSRSRRAWMVDNSMLAISVKRQRKLKMKKKKYKKLMKRLRHERRKHDRT